MRAMLSIDAGTDGAAVACTSCTAYGPVLCSPRTWALPNASSPLVLDALVAHVLPLPQLSLLAAACVVAVAVLSQERRLAMDRCRTEAPWTRRAVHVVPASSRKSSTFHRIISASLGSGSGGGAAGVRGRGTHTAGPNEANPVHASPVAGHGYRFGTVR